MNTYYVRSTFSFNFVARVLINMKTMIEQKPLAILGTCWIVSNNSPGRKDVNNIEHLFRQRESGLF